MKRIVLKSMLAACIACSATFVPATAQEHDHSHDGHDHAAPGHVHTGESVAYQLAAWKSLHFDDAQKAAQHAATVKKLGCEVRQSAHSGHTDVSYRCPEWKTLAVANHQLAAQWIGWLKGSGFDVSHAHPASQFATGPEAVEFRLIKWKSLHGTNSPQETQLVNQLKTIGCEVAVEQHNGHSDIRFRAPTWRDIHVADHASAEQWSTWLEQNGFEVHHSH
ncbi:MAG: hypothetical protein ACTHK7_11800 [Aureliella sp.]